MVLAVLVGSVIPADRFLLRGNPAVTSLRTLAMTCTVMPAPTRLLGSWLRNP
ncbi:hypothetical protein [Streptomyces sp. RKAG337]|uniref:hypothetical protein n=1 Tax=Streptomyces sp. RKAG337 TaxID=2893404 RepID=UPI002034264E|nr:hypothetical protein [Streptomyces sp. RKAG337]MCM2424971.1 hypothetical protein [Streptomyces sp. RKAG337]